MSEIRTIFKRVTLPLLLLITISTVGALFNVTSVFADYSEMPTQLLPTYSNHLSTNTNDLSTGEGLASESIRIAVYTNQSTSPVRVIFDGSSCSNYDRALSRVSTYNNDNSTGTPSVSNPSNLAASGMCSSSGGDTVFYLDPLYFAPSQKFGSGVRVALLTVRIQDGVTRSPKISVLGSNRLGYVGYPNPGSNSKPNSIGELAYGPGLSRDGSRGTITLRFAPPCSFPTQSVKLYWRDADSEKDANRSPEDPTEKVTFRIFDDTDSSYSMAFAEGADDASGVLGRNFTARAKHKYHVTFYNVKGNAGSSIANAIQIWHPFSSSGYYDDCMEPLPSGWSVSWVSNYVVRNDGINFGTLAGDLSDPGDSLAPQPGQSFRYINDARNAGARSISNGRWLCGVWAGSYINSSGSHVRCRPASSSSANKWWHLIGNTQNISFSNGVNAGINTPRDGYINGPGWVWDNFGISAADGGTSRCMQASLSPSNGTAIPYTSADGLINYSGKTKAWSIGGGATAPRLCVNVPHYYNLQQSVTVGGRDGVTVQQGTNLQITGTVSQPSASGSRNHTNSHPGKEKGVLQFRLDPGEAEPSVKTGQGPIATSPIDWCNGRSSGLATCTKLLTDARVVNAGGDIKIPNNPGNGNIFDVNTSNLPVGTKMCYATYANHPKHTTEDDYNNGDGRWSYSSIECATVVKSPKVHFLNTDVTVGRYRTTATDCQPAVNAPIITTGTPDSRRSSNLYGSWVEYGAFATGNITSFGSGAAPSDSNFESTRLTFGNTPSDLGEFIYGKNCLADPFGIVKDTNSTNLADVSAFDQATGILSIDGLSRGDDKTGYVSTNENIHIGPPTAATPSTPTPVPPTSNVPYTITVRAGAEIYPAGGCPAMHIRLTDLSGAVKNFNQNVCQSLQSGAGWNNWRNYSFNTTIDGGGVATLEVLYNPPDAWGGTSASDRNLYVHSIAVRNNATSTTTDVNTNRSTPNLRLILPRGAPRGPEQTMRPTDPSPSNNCFVNNTSPTYTQMNDRVALFQSIENAVPAAASVAAGNAWCAGFRVTNIEEPPLPPPPPSVSLSSSYTGFNGRNIVIYSKKTSAGNCSATSDGNLTINQDILFKKDGFANVLDLPRIIFMADCNITIADNVVEVNATLIAGDAIKTCSARVESQDKCDRALTVKGGISANRLLLWRTHGSDLTQSGAEIPAETFDLSPSQVITGYNRGLRSAKPTTVYEVDLPPRY